jgi:outer membrane lipoprotein-sorting protein
LAAVPLEEERMPRYRIAALALAAAVLSGACAQRAPDPKALLAEVAQTYKNASRYWIEAKMFAEQSAQGRSEKVEAVMHVAGDTTGHMRVQMDAQDAQAMLVSNGIDLWVYQAMGPQKQYAQLASATTDSTMRSELLNRLLRAQFPALPIVRYREVDVLADSATLEREETIKVGDDEIDCYVIKSQTSSEGTVGMASTPVTLWVDKERKVIWREERTATVNDPQMGERKITERIDFTRIRLNEALPDSLFAFQPPPGATPMNIAGQPPQ